MKLTHLLCCKPRFMLCRFIYNSSPHGGWREVSGCLNETLRLTVYRAEKRLETFLIQQNNQYFKTLPTILHSKCYSNLACRHKRHCQKKYSKCTPQYIVNKNKSKYCKQASDQLPFRDYSFLELSHVENETKFSITCMTQKYMLMSIHSYLSIIFTICKVMENKYFGQLIFTYR